jgi:RimJ/RimL family protein N-acetyltransferase
MPADEPVRVRPATVDDVAAQVDLMERVAAEGRWIGREAPVDREQLTERFRSSADDPARLSLVVTQGDQVVGSLGLDDDGYGHAELYMFLAADARGRGLGTALLVEAIAWARANPTFHKVTLQAWPHNAAALALYRRHGFVVEGYLHRHWRRNNGELWDAVVMGLLLEPED